MSTNEENTEAEAGEHKLARPLTMGEFRTELHAFRMAIKKDITDALSSIGATAPSFPLNNNGVTVQALPVYTNDQQQWARQYDIRPSAGHPLTNASNIPPAPRPPANPHQHSHASLPQTTGGAPPKQQHRALPPIPVLRIDDLGKGPNAWLKAVHQWNVAASPGVLPLKSWQPRWYQGDMAPHFASKRSQRRTIAEEYARYNSDKEAFPQDYPMAGSIKNLLNEIRRRHQRRRISCNGTPEERDS